MAGQLLLTARTLGPQPQKAATEVTQGRYRRPSTPFLHPQVKVSDGGNLTHSTPCENKSSYHH